MVASSHELPSRTSSEAPQRALRLSFDDRHQVSRVRVIHLRRVQFIAAEKVPKEKWPRQGEHPIVDASVPASRTDFDSMMNGSDASTNERLVVIDLETANHALA
jgi:hypothetical protein